MKVTVDQPELEKFIAEKINSGTFGSPAEVIEAGLARLMLDPVVDELDAEDISAVAESDAQIARGEDRDWKEVAAELRQKYLNR